MTSVLAELPQPNVNHDLSDDDEDDEVRKNSRRQNRHTIVTESDDDENMHSRLNVMMSSDDESSDDDDDSSDDDDSRKKSLTLDEAMGKKMSPVKTTSDGGYVSTKPKKTTTTRPQKAKPRRRRRSSARFLRLSGRFDLNAEDDDDAAAGQSQDQESQEHLGEMYKRAIRMNAENRINAGNSWGLRLIENIDKFLVDDDDDAAAARGGGGLSQEDAVDLATSAAASSAEKRVNFTKASCTLDASVKIYSYRVDDVHLTSYKVLANLNRTDMGKTKDSGADQGNDNNADDNGSSSPRRKTNQGRGEAAETLESNISNINMNKLDSAFDIDPLFHKMSKTFDEGGAKGLLLVNLGVGSNGCGIVFDSKEDSDDGNKNNPAEEETKDNDDDEENDKDDHVMMIPEGTMDISSLTTKLESLLGGATIDSLPLVPQLASLREEHAMLEAEGFVDDNIPKSKSRRYASSHEEEKEAEMSIHQEHLERSRASMGGISLGGTSIGQENSDEKVDSPIDFGGGGGFDDGNDDDDDDYGFNDFVAMDENGARYSSISFQNSEDLPSAFSNDAGGGGITQAASQATVFLDALSSGDAMLNRESQYEYFNQTSLEKITGGNLWAGSAHWKKNERLARKKKTTPEAANEPSSAEQKRPARGRKKKKKEPKKKARTLVDLRNPPSSSLLADILKPPTKSKRGTDPLLFPKATKTKHSKTDNLLPPDAGIGIEELSKLFMRPNAVMPQQQTGEEKSALAKQGKKSVGFYNLGFDDGDDDSFGGDDDGPGFDFADPSDGTYGANDDFVVRELEGVRKVDKVQVGYATVAKKVDVKRLKKDLWNAIETTILPSVQEENANTIRKDVIQDSDTEEETKDPEMLDASNQVKCLSFKETVTGLESSKTQMDVSLPFYFICLLHLANEKGLRLDSTSLKDFIIGYDDGAAPALGTLPTKDRSTTASSAVQRGKRVKEKTATYEALYDTDEDEESDADSEH